MIIALTVPRCQSLRKQRFKFGCHLLQVHVSATDLIFSSPFASPRSLSSRAALRSFVSLWILCTRPRTQHLTLHCRIHWQNIGFSVQGFGCSVEHLEYKA
eukprot:1441831-Rhodomonas_salina.2